MSILGTKRPLRDLHGEHFYAASDAFVRYVMEEVNPHREAAGLTPHAAITVRDCFRLLRAHELAASPASGEDA